MVIPIIPTNDVTSAFVFPRKGWIIPIALTTSRVSIFAREALNIIPMTKIINIWYSALQTPEDYFWHGVGAGGNSDYLVPIYAEHDWDKFTERQYNAHNQYIGELIDLGIFAATFFLLIWLLYPLWYKGRVRQFASLVVLTLALNMLTENMLDRIEGVIITCVILITTALLFRDQLAK